VVGALLATAALPIERAGRRRLGGAAFHGAWMAMAFAIAGYTASAFDTAAASRLRFAQLTGLLRTGNTIGQAPTLRRCALAAAEPGASTPANAFRSCLGKALGATGVEPSGNDIANRYAASIELNRRRVWPPCRERSDQLLALKLSPAQREIAQAIGRYCTARARLEATVEAGVGDNSLDAASLQKDLVPLELVSALADGATALPLPEGADRVEWRREAAAFARWQASLTRDDIELARLADCPFALCRRDGAR